MCAEKYRSDSESTHGRKHARRRTAATAVETSRLLDEV
jgi:hypothetical protein